MGVAAVAQIQAEAWIKAKSLHNDLLTLKVAAIAYVGSCTTSARKAHITSGT